MIGLFVFGLVALSVFVGFYCWKRCAAYVRYGTAQHSQVLYSVTSQYLNSVVLN